MKKEIYKRCGLCGGRGYRKSHVPSKDSVMFGLLDFGISAAISAVKGEEVECNRCDGEGVVLDRIEIIK